MTIEEFRSHETLPGQWAKELSTNEVLRAVLGCMNDNHPAHFAIHGDKNEDVSPVRAGIELGLTRGWFKYSDTLFLLAKRKMATPGAGQTTYEPELKEKQNA
jgi:hypothetical protein